MLIGFVSRSTARDAHGLPDTNGGLYLRADDLSKLGYLVLRGGTWEDRKLLRPEWIRASFSESVSKARDFKYGFLCWLVPCSEGSSSRVGWAAHGFGGQRLLVVPEHDLIIVLTGWTIPHSALRGHEIYDRLLTAVLQ